MDIEETRIEPLPQRGHTCSSLGLYEKEMKEQIQKLLP